MTETGIPVRRGGHDALRRTDTDKAISVKQKRSEGNKPRNGETDTEGEEPLWAFDQTPPDGDGTG
jgi:hypothetical protein